ncbi:MAG TPA: hypothetical protein VKA66_17730, partial [Mycobacterium sp.]|nr:hypothetical protein [Mycobacterium sp.]
MLGILLAPPSAPSPEVGIGQEALDGICHRVHVTTGDDQASLGIPGVLAWAAVVSDDDRHSAHHGFLDDVAA